MFCPCVFLFRYSEKIRPVYTMTPVPNWITEQTLQAMRNYAPANKLTGHEWETKPNNQTHNRTQHNKHTQHNTHTQHNNTHAQHNNTHSPHNTHNHTHTHTYTHTHTHTSSTFVLCEESTRRECTIGIFAVMDLCELTVVLHTSIGLIGLMG